MGKLVGLTAVFAVIFGLIGGEALAQGRTASQPSSTTQNTLNYCEILLSKDYEYWSHRLDEAEVAIDKAISNFNEEELDFIGQTISDNKTERKSTTCRWGTEEIVQNRLLNDTSIVFGQDLKTAYDAYMNSQPIPTTDVYFMVQILGAHSCTDDFRYQALALRMGDLYRRQLYEVDCPF